MLMLPPSSRVPVQWPSEISLEDDDCDDAEDDGGIDGAFLPSTSPMSTIDLDDEVAAGLNIFQAAELGNVGVMSAYLNGGGNPNTASKEGYSTLHLAAMRDQLSVVDLLLKSGADPDTHESKEGLTPLMWAAQLGHAEVAVSLLEQGADIEGEDKEDLTALHWAARLGRERIVRVLLDHGADVEAIDYDGNTPLIWAARGGHRGCLNTLLDNGALTTTPDENGNTALHFSCQTGNAGIASDLLDWGALVTAQDYWKFTPFHRACSQGHGNVLVELLRVRAAPKGEGPVDPAHVNTQGSSPTVAGEGEAGAGREARAWGLEGRGDGGGEFSPALGLPSEIIDQRNHFQATPLHRAAAKGHAEVVKMLLQNGADTNARDGFFYTPLHLACVNSSISCVDVLLRAGADPTTKAQGGVTPLQGARKPEIRELLRHAASSWKVGSAVKDIDAAASSAAKGSDARWIGNPGYGDGHGDSGSDGGPEDDYDDFEGYDNDVCDRDRMRVSIETVQTSEGEGSGADDNAVSRNDGEVPHIAVAAADDATGNADDAGLAMDSENAAAAAVTTSIGSPERAAMTGISSNVSSPSAGPVQVRNLPGDDAFAALSDDERNPKRNLSRSDNMEVDDDHNDDGVDGIDVQSFYLLEGKIVPFADASASASASGTSGTASDAAVSAARSNQPPVTRGRPTHRVARQQQEATRARPRRTSTGSMLQKVFNSPPQSVSKRKTTEGDAAVATPHQLDPAGALGTSTDVTRALVPVSVDSPKGSTTIAATASSAREAHDYPLRVTRQEGETIARESGQLPLVTTTAQDSSCSVSGTATKGCASISPGRHFAALTLTSAPPEMLLHKAPRIKPVQTLRQASVEVVVDALPRYVSTPLTTQTPFIERVTAAAVPRVTRGMTAKMQGVVEVTPSAKPGSASASAAATAVMPGASATTQDTSSIPTAAAKARTTDLSEEAEKRIAHKRRRARSLPPCLEGDEQSTRRRRGAAGREPRPPRKQRLESRPCMHGPTAVIKTLRLDDARRDDKALTCRLQDVWTLEAAVGGGPGTTGGGSDSPLSSSPAPPIRRATTLVG